VEFGAKINVSFIDGFLFLDEISWDAFNEGCQMMDYVEHYKRRFGYYPAELLADQIDRKFFSSIDHALLQVC
jgi:IS5 family transposase